MRSSGRSTPRRDELGIDPAELRRRNYIAADAFPFETGLVFTYDRARRDQHGPRAGAVRLRRARGSQGAGRGARQAVRGGHFQRDRAIRRRVPGMAQIRFDPSGSLTLTMGTHNHGQGHETVFRQLLSDKLGLDFERIRIAQGDSDEVMAGTGTFGSRSSGVGGASIMMAAEKVIERCLKIAATGWRPRKRTSRSPTAPSRSPAPTGRSGWSTRPSSPSPS